MREHPEVFWPSYAPDDHPGWRHLFDALMDQLPDEHLWALAFCNMDTLYWVSDDNGNDIGTFDLIWYKPASSLHNTQYIWSHNTKRFTAGSRGIHKTTGDKHKEFVQATLTEIATFMTENMRPWLDKGVHPEFISYRNQLFGSLLQYTINVSIYVIETGYEAGALMNAVSLRDRLVVNGDSWKLRQRNQGWMQPKIAVAERITKTNRRPLHKVFGYTENVLSMLEWPIILKNEYNPTLYGVELEVATSYDASHLIDAADELFFICKQDSSISGTKRNKMEMVTVPMSLKAHKQQWARWFSKLEYHHFDTSHETNNGMHVHISRRAFADATHIRNFTWFFNNPANNEFVFLLSERNRRSFEQYSPTVSWNRDIRKGKAFKLVESMAAQLRGAVAVGRKDKTVEVRLFRGVVSYASVLKNLECVDAIYEFTKQPGISFTLRSFLSWLNATSTNKYIVFKKWLKGIDLETVLLNADLQDVIFAETDPVKVKDMLNKRKFKVTRDHIEYLNSKAQARVYALNADGSVSLWQRPDLKGLNLELQKRYA